MAKFVRHESCPSCGSRDNLGRYSDGSAFCFGCHYTERGTISPFVGERNGEIERNGDQVRLPEDATRDLSPKCLEWLSKYRVSVLSALRGRFRYSPGRDQLLFPVYGEDGELVCVQARNFNPKQASKAKYYNVGEKSLHTTIYGTSDTVVLVEDCVSALRIGEFYAGFPLLGTSISRERLKWLGDRFKRIVVWLDSDKLREARTISDSVKLLGINSTTVFTPLDPKCYSLDEIKEFVK